MKSARKKTSPKKIFGLDISDLSLKAVEIRQKGNKTFIGTISMLSLAPGLIEEGSIKDKKKVAAALNNLISKAKYKFETKYVVLSLPEPKTFIKVIEIANKEMGEDKTSQLIKKELPRHIPIDIEEVQIDWQIIEKNKQKTKFLVGAVPKNIVEEYLNLCTAAGLEAVALEIEALAIQRAVMPQFKTNEKQKNWKDIKNYWKKKDKGQITQGN